MGQLANCSVCENLKIVTGDIDDYNRLSRFHYRDSGFGAFAAIFAIRPIERLAGWGGTGTVGVIVYTMPCIGCELRGAAMGDVFSGFDRSTRLALLNRNIRCICRVIIEPRFRGLGLAGRLVRETMGLMAVPVIEAMAVMGSVNPFFEKAGMRAYSAPMPARCVQLIEAFSAAGIEREQLTDSASVQRAIERLPERKAEFIEREIRSFLAGYGKRANMSPGLLRTSYIISRLTARPSYYIWFNPDLQLVTS